MLFLCRVGGLYMTLTLKQTTEETGLSADTLRYYEKKGIFTSNRHENGYRFYDEHDLAILKIITVMKYAHFTLNEIKSMVELFKREPSEECNTAGKQILKSKIIELEQKICNYRQIVALMKELLPLIDDACINNENEKHIDDFIEKIFNNITE